MCGCGGGMHGGGMGYGRGFFPGGLAHLAGSPRSGEPVDQADPADPETILKARLARRDITLEEYRQLREVLRENAS